MDATTFALRRLTTSVKEELESVPCVSRTPMFRYAGTESCQAQSNVRMETSNQAMAAVLTVRPKRDGNVTEDQVLPPVLPLVETPP